MTQAPLPVELPRGGYLVKTSEGIVQLGAPPETIKDTMVRPEKVPNIFILPGMLFHTEKGIAVAELEFPIYFNFFILQKKTHIICTAEQKKQLETVLTESIFGPEQLDISSEFLLGKDDPSFPDLRAEIAFFRGGRQLDDIVEFFLFEDHRCRLGTVEIIRHEGRAFEIHDRGQLLAELPWNIEYKIQYETGARLPEPFEAPDFGITCLGASHGFDPQDNTSGFIVWINKRGIMVDPPVNSTEWLKQANVNAKLISHVILTHCHADHDAGTFQKILEENRITIHTTETVMDSFLRKYTALTREPKKRLYELFDFQPVFINSPVHIEGAEFFFNYTLHSIPTIGFRLQYRNRSFLYTSDHLNHPETLEKLNSQNMFPPGRYRFLRDFPWHYDIIYHEAGIPPLHTPVSYLASLPPEIKKKISVYHIASKDFPADSGLSLARFGIENTLYPPVETSAFAHAIEILDIMNHVDLFADFKVSKAREFLSIIKEVHFARGETILKKGSSGNEFYIIVSGNVSVLGTRNEFGKTYGKYEYFGEAALVNDQPRSADVVAETDVTALVISKNSFLNFIEGTPLENSLRHLSAVRETNSWDILSASPIFAEMSSHQKTQLESLIRQKHFAAGQLLLDEKKPAESGYILVSGQISLLAGGRQIKQPGTGDFIGDIFSLQKNTPPPFSAQAASETEVYEISRENMAAFIAGNPGVYMRLLRASENT